MATIARTPYSFVYTVTPYRPTKSKTENPDKPPLTVEERRKNKLKSRKARVRRKMTTHIYKYFLTLTEGKNGTFNHPEKLYIDKFCGELIKQRIAYICVTEQHENGNLHYHIVTDKQPDGFSSKVWDSNRKKMVTYSVKVNEEFGRNEIEEIDDFFSIGYYQTIKYMTKYITKQDFEIRYSRNVNPESLEISRLFRYSPRHRLDIGITKNCYRNGEYEDYKTLYERPYIEQKFIPVEVLELAYKLHCYVDLRKKGWFLKKIETKRKAEKLSQMTFNGFISFDELIKERRKKQILPNLI